MTTAEVAKRINAVLEEQFDGGSYANHSWEELAGWMAELDSIAETAAILREKIGGHLYEVMPDYEQTVNGVPFKKVSGSTRKNWDHFRLGSLLAARAADDYTENVPPAVLADHVMREVLACAAPSYWRVGELKKRNIAGSDYCDVESGTPRVIIDKKKRRKAEAA